VPTRKKRHVAVGRQRLPHESGLVEQGSDACGGVERQPVGLVVSSVEIAGRREDRELARRRAAGDVLALFEEEDDAVATKAAFPHPAGTVAAGPRDVEEEQAAGHQRAVDRRETLAQPREADSRVGGVRERLPHRRHRHRALRQRRRPQRALNPPRLRHEPARDVEHRRRNVDPEDVEPGVRQPAVKDPASRRQVEHQASLEARRRQSGQELARGGAGHHAEVVVVDGGQSRAVMMVRSFQGSRPVATRKPRLEPSSWGRWV